jgi:hypothetical protein
LSEGACGDDPSTDEEIKENGSEGHFPIHPDEVGPILAGGHQTSHEVFTLSERVGEDDPSVSRKPSSESSTDSSSSESSNSESSSSELCSSESSNSSDYESEEESGLNEEDELPPLIRLKDEEGEDPPIREARLLPWPGPSINIGTEERVVPDPRTFVSRVHPRYRMVEQGIEQRHLERHQAFHNRKRQVNQRIDVKSLKPSPITEQIEWESVEKGSPLWKERQDFHWKSEIERMFIPWPAKEDVKM